MVSLLSILVFFIPLALACSSSVEPDTVLSASYYISILSFAGLWFLVKGLSWEKLRPLKYPFLFFVFSLAFAVVFLIGRSQSLEQIGKYAVGIILFLLVAPLSEYDKQRLISIIMGAAFFISLIALYQYFFGFKILLNYVRETKMTDPFVMEKIAERRVFFPFMTPAVLGGYLAMVLPLTLSPKKKFLYFVSLVWALFLSQSLGAFLSLAIVYAAFLVIQSHSGKKKAIIFLALGLVLGGIFALRTGTPRQHLLPTFSLTTRFHYWADTWKIICAHPWTGLGFGNFDLRETRYAHNFLLQLWAEGGLVILVSFLWLVGTVLQNGLRASGRALGPGVAAGVFVFLIHNLMDFSFFLPAVSYIGWIMLGLLYFPGPQHEGRPPS